MVQVVVRLVALTVVLLATPEVVFSQGLQRSPAALAAAGWTAIEERRFDDALEAFTEAAGPGRSDPYLCTGAGFAAFMLGQDAEAQSWLEQALKLVPKNTDASLLLGELHHRAGRVKEAVSTVRSRAQTRAQRACAERQARTMAQGRDRARGLLRVSRGTLQRALPGTGRRDDRATRGRNARRDVTGGLARR